MTDFSIYAGDTRTLEITVTDEAGDVLDLTGSGLFWALARINGSAELLNKEIGDGITVIDAPAGRFDIALEPSDTEALYGSYYHEAVLVDGSDNISTIMTGTVTVTETLLSTADVT